MCGRAFVTYSEEELALRYIGKKRVVIPHFDANYNFSPSQNGLTIRSEGGELKIAALKWGLVPSWARDPKIGYKMINARSETILEKPSFKAAFKRRRCIVPLSGFFEWKKEGASKRPFCISLRDEPIMSVAGIWEHWSSPQQEVIESFTILTTAANRYMSQFHERMPVILGKEDEGAWLDVEHKEAGEIVKLLRPCPDEWLKAYEVSTLVNSPKNNSPEVLKSLENS